VHIITSIGECAGMDSAGEPGANDEDVSQPGSPKISIKVALVE